MSACGVVVGVHHQHHGQRRDAPDCGEQLFAVALRRAGVDDDDPFAADDEAGVDDVAAVGEGEVLLEADDHPRAGRELARLQAVVERLRVCRCGEQQQAGPQDREHAARH
jgi:hypothetical protein